MAASDAFYLELLIEVDSILDELGTTYTIRTPGLYDESSLSTSPPTTRTVSGIVADQSLMINILGGTGSQVSEWVGKKNLLLKSTSLPKNNEEIEVDGNWFALDKIVALKPADVTLLYILDVTR